MTVPLAAAGRRANVGRLPAVDPAEHPDVSGHPANGGTAAGHAHPYASGRGAKYLHELADNPVSPPKAAFSADSAGGPKIDRT